MNELADIRFNSGTPGYAWLSNFHIAPLEYDGQIYSSVEHAYQAAKTLDPVIRAHIAKQWSARDAKREGKRIALRADWNDVKLNVMRSLIDIKFFGHARLGQALLNTNGHKLIHLSPWDTYWGVDYQGSGHNHLGHIIMNTRTRLTALA